MQIPLEKPRLDSHWNPKQLLCAGNLIKSDQIKKSHFFVIGEEMA